MIHMSETKKLYRAQRTQEQQKRAQAAAENRKREERLARYKRAGKFIAAPLGADQDSCVSLLISTNGLDFFEGAEDYRDQSKITYQLSDILTMVFLSVCAEGSCEFEHIADYIDFYQEEFEALGLIHDGQVPSHDTIRTIFSNMDSSSFRESTIGAIHQMVSRLSEPTEKLHHLALDGKEICGTGRAKGTRKPARNTNVFNVYDVTNGINLIAEPIDSKTNEIPTGQDIIYHLDIKGKMITGDAMQTKEKMCSLIDWKKGFYVFPVKDARTTLYKETAEIFEDPALKKSRKKYVIGDRVFEVCKLGRTRKLTDYPSVRLVVKMISYVRGEENPFVQYFISNQAKTDPVLDAICCRWSIENDLHKLKDSSLINEDGIRFRDETALRNMTVITDLIAAFVQMYRALEPGMKLKFAKMAMKGKTLLSMEKVLKALGDEEFLRQLRESRQRKPKKGKSKVPEDLDSDEE